MQHFAQTDYFFISLNIILVVLLFDICFHAISLIGNNLDAAHMYIIVFIVSILITVLTPILSFVILNIFFISICLLVSKFIIIYLPLFIINSPVSNGFL